MTEPCINEIERVIRSAAQSGEILVVTSAARSIAAQCGGSPKLIAEALTESGIRAGLTMQFGKVE